MLSTELLIIKSHKNRSLIRSDALRDGAKWYRLSIKDQSCMVIRTACLMNWIIGFTLNSTFVVAFFLWCLTSASVQKISNKVKALSLSTALVINHGEPSRMIKFQSMAGWLFFRKVSSSSGSRRCQDRLSDLWKEFEQPLCNTPVRHINKTNEKLQQQKRLQRKQAPITHTHTHAHARTHTHTHTRTFLNQPLFGVFSGVDRWGGSFTHAYF